MSAKIFVVPTLGEPLPYPGGVLPIAGDYIDPDDTFWRRRLADKDVEKAKPVKAEAAPTDTAAPAAPAADPATPAKPKK